MALMLLMIQIRILHNFVSNNMMFQYGLFITVYGSNYNLFVIKIENFREKFLELKKIEPSHCET